MSAIDMYERAEGNVAGPWFVSTDCVDCGMCPEIAPMVFRREADPWSVVYHQPETAEEEKLAEEARESCPVEAIHCERSNRET